MRGDVFALKAPREARGHEQRGARCAIVVHSDDLHTSTWTVVPTSRSASAALHRPPVVVLDEVSVALADQTTAIDPERLGTRVGRLSYDETQAVDAALRLVLALD